LPYPGGQLPRDTQQIVELRVLFETCKEQIDRALGRPLVLQARLQVSGQAARSLGDRFNILPDGFGRALFAALDLVLVYASDLRCALLIAYVEYALNVGQDAHQEFKKRTLIGVAFVGLRLHRRQCR
jgi:hypothetical protein